jgi:hypothetical protein
MGTYCGNIVGVACCFSGVRLCLAFDVYIDCHCGLFVVPSSSIVKTSTEAAAAQENYSNDRNDYNHQRETFVSFPAGIIPAAAATEFASYQPERYGKFLIEGTLDIVRDFCSATAAVLGLNLLIDTVLSNIAKCRIRGHDKGLRLFEGSINGADESVHAALANIRAVGTCRITCEAGIR